MDKFVCPNSIIDSMGKAMESFVAALYFVLILY